METAQPIEYRQHTTVLLFDEDGSVEDRSVWSGTGEIYFIAQKLMGYKELEYLHYNMSLEDTNLIVAIYVNSEGPVDSTLNVQLSYALGSEVFGKAVLVCFEESLGDEAQSEWSNVISHEKLLEKLAKRGKPVPVYHDHDVYPGILGDLMRELRDRGMKK